MSNNKFKTAVASALALVLLPAQAQTVDGSWNGKLDIGTAKLNIVFNFSKGDDGKTLCTLDSPDQGAKGIPATVEYVSEDSVAVAVPAIMAKYNGRVRDGKIDGTFTQAGMSLKLVLSPGSVEIKRPQTPKPPFPYITEEVTFSNAKDGTVLSGTLSLPLMMSIGKKVPVVLMVTGSGQQNRDEELLGHKPFLVIADFLARHGIATLRYDDRGVGKSKGNASEVTMTSNMLDAMAGIDFLRKDDRFSKVGMLGHSEGGTIAFLSASKYADKLDFIVSMAGTGVRGDSIIVYQNRVMLESSGAPQTDIDNYCRLLGKVLEYRIGHDRATVDGAAVIDSLAKSEKVSLPAPALQNLAEVLTSPSPWMDQFLSFDPQKDISNVICPVMAINGSLDKQVDPSMNLGAIKRLLPKNDANLIKEYPSLNHLFQHCSKGYVAEYATIEETISEDVMADIADWIKGLK